MTINTKTQLKDLLKITNQYRIFIDTCVWMYPPSKEFLINILPEALFTRKATVKVPYRVIEEINRKLKDKEKEARRRAKFASMIMNKYIEAGLVQVLGDEDDPFTDQTILYVFQKYSDRHHLCLITRDRNLAKDVHQLTKQGAVKKKDILLFGINEEGSTYQWIFKEECERKTIQFSYQNKPRNNKKKKKPQVSMPKNMEFPSIQKNATKQEMDTIEHGSFVLGEILAHGEESVVYKAKKGYVCKLFLKHKLTAITYQKVIKMINIPMDEQDICWPVDIVLNKKGEFLGYLMREGKGDFLYEVLKTKPYLLKKFPKWNRIQLVDLALTFLRSVETLHKKGIIIGNVNLNHFMIQDEKKIYFINTDGYQVGEFHGNPSLNIFTPPEILLSKEESRRTKEYDLYSVAVAIFMILLPGKIPYSFQGSGNKDDHILTKQFPFPFSPTFIARYESSAWSSIWANLPYNIQQLFYDTFINDKRFSLHIWSMALRFYKDSLKNHQYSSELFPQGIQLSKEKSTQAKCYACKSTFTIHKKELTRLMKKTNMTICEGCFKQYQRLKRGDSASFPASITKKYKENKESDWSNEISFLDALVKYRDEIKEDKAYETVTSKK